MKKLAIFIILTVGYLSVYGQVRLVVEVVYISDLTVCYSEGEIHDDRDMGPSIGFKCRIINSKSEPTRIFPIKADLSVEYNYKGILLSKEIISPLSFHEIESKILSSTESFDFVISTRLLHSTNLLKTAPADYSTELLNILPTIKVVYREAENGFRIESAGVCRVIILE